MVDTWLPLMVQGSNRTGRGTSAIVSTVDRSPTIEPTFISLVRYHINMSVNHLTGNVYEIIVKPRRTFVLADTPSGGTTLVDTGDENTADELVAILEDQFGSIDSVYLTHSGSDHYGGLEQVIDAFDPEVYAASDETDLLDAINYDPDVLFEDGDVLPGNVEVVQISGHSPAPSAFLLPEENALISGDVLDGADRRGLPKGYLLPPPEMYNYDHAAAERGLKRLLEYDFESVFVFHGSHVYEDAKAKLDHYVNFKEHYRDDHR